ncbi:MAG: DUF5110 domain-containing protein, partial [Spirochaetaceae bacterium]|nr:DUF5110 domain-containing protein [Spirochaetaceae bacterium]
PPVRALSLDYQDDERTHVIDDQFMLGDSLLVAPVFRGEKSRNIFLPPGEWYDFWTNERFDGGRTLVCETPLDVIPVFVRSGVILPLAEPVQCVEEHTLFRLTLLCFGSGEKCFTLYEDDGTSLAYEEGKYNRVILTQNVEGGVDVTRSGAEPPRYDVKEWKYIDCGILL